MTLIAVTLGGVLVLIGGILAALALVSYVADEAVKNGAWSANEDER